MNFVTGLPNPVMLDAMFNAADTAVSDFNYQRWLDDLGNFSLGAQIGGQVTQAIGNYYAAQSQRDQLKARALSADFAAQTAEFNMRMASHRAAKVREAAEQQVGLTRMRYAEERASARAGAAARGVDVDEGSALEQERAIQLASEIDSMTIQMNADEQAFGVELEGANQATAAAMARVSARNIRSTANAISPTAAYFTTEVGNAARTGSAFYERFGNRGRVFDRRSIR